MLQNYWKEDITPWNYCSAVNKLLLHVYNCAGQNKSRFVLIYLCAVQLCTQQFHPALIASCVPCAYVMWGLWKDVLPEFFKVPASFQITKHHVFKLEGNTLEMICAKYFSFSTGESRDMTDEFIQVRVGKVLGHI